MLTISATVYAPASSLALTVDLFDLRLDDRVIRPLGDLLAALDDHFTFTISDVGRGVGADDVGD